MAHTEITKWLESHEPNFKQGLYLLDTFGRGYKLPFPAAILKNRSSYSAKKLYNALSAVNATIATTRTAELKPSKFLPKHTRGKTNGYPAHLIEIDRSLAVEWSELNTLANKKHELPEGPELEKVALEVVGRYRELRDKWKQLDYFAAYGMVMPGTQPSENPEGDVESTLCEWLRIQPSYIDYTRRYRKSTDPAKRKEAERRQNKLDEIADYLNTRAHAN
jgi:hypothetical protein